MDKESLKHAISLIEALEETPLPESAYFRTVVVMKEIDSDTPMGSISKDEMGHYSFNV